MKKFLLTAAALGMISGSAFAAADEHVKRLDQVPTKVTGTVMTTDSFKAIPDAKPHYINGSQLR